jgi:hypothetical protein
MEILGNVMSAFPEILRDYIISDAQIHSIKLNFIITSA